MPTGMIINIQYYCTHLENKVRPAVCHKQPELLEHCVIFLQDIAAPHHHHNVQNLVNWWGCEVLALIPTLSILLHVITGCLHMWKNIFRLNDLNQKLISTLLSLPLFIIWARLNAELQLIICHIDGKSVWTLMVVTLCQGRICSAVILYFVIILKSCTKLLKWPA